MNRLDATSLVPFSRRYRLAQARIRSLRWRTRGSEHTLMVTVSAKRAIQDLGAADEMVRLKFTLKGVEEFRFQKRQYAPQGTKCDIRVGFFQGLVFVNFDVWEVLPGVKPEIFDYRASEKYAAAREVFWEEITKIKKTPAA